MICLRRNQGTLVEGEAGWCQGLINCAKTGQQAAGRKPALVSSLLCTFLPSESNKTFIHIIYPRVKKKTNKPKAVQLSPQFPIIPLEDSVLIFFFFFPLNQKRLPWGITKRSIGRGSLKEP